MTQPRPAAPSPERTRGPLVQSLVTLAGTPDDVAQVDSQLIVIAQLTADLVPSVSYASVTAMRDGAFTTVAASSEVARAVDEAQYADGAGPCMDAVDLAEPVAVPEMATTIATTMAWPGFRDTAFRLGLRASLSIPLFAGSGAPIAALNLYGHDAAAMEPLIAAVWSVYDPHRTGAGGNERAQPLDPGSEQLIAGLTEAFSVRALIQQAIGVVMAAGQRPPDSAYLHLRDQAARNGGSLFDAASAVLVSRGQ